MKSDNWKMSASKQASNPKAKAAREGVSPKTAKKSRLDRKHVKVHLVRALGPSNVNVVCIMSASTFHDAVRHTFVWSQSYGTFTIYYSMHVLWLYAAVCHNDVWIRSALYDFLQRRPIKTYMVCTEKAKIHMPDRLLLHRRCFHYYAVGILVPVRRVVYSR